MIRTSKHRCSLIMITATFLLLLSAGSLLAGVGDIDINVPSSAPQGSTISCDVTVNVGTAVLGSYDVIFTFDHTVLQIAEIGGGTTSEFSDIPTYGDIETANTIGQIHIVAYQSSITTPTNVVGIFRIRFDVIGTTGTSSTLSMIDTSILNPDSGAISHQVQDANILVDSGGAISGTVYKSDGTTPLTGTAIQVNIISSDPCGSWPNPFASTYTDSENGTFWISGLPTGTYYLKTWNNGSPYLDEWWSFSASSTNCLDAGLVTVTDGAITPGTDFQLDDGATISGTVFQDDGTTPVTGASIQIHVYWGNPCGFMSQVNYGFSDTTDGTYTVGGLPAGNYYLLTDNMNQSNYMGAWWAASGSDTDCAGAQFVPVAVGDSITHKDFQLDEGGAISGTLFQADGTTPITGVSIDVAAHTGDPCGAYEHSMGRGSDPATGNYLISGIPPGNHSLKTTNWSTPYLDEWWASPSSSPDCADAGTVTVTAGTTTTDKNFQLEDGATVSGTVFQSDGETPIIGVGINVRMVSGDPCGFHQYTRDVKVDTGTGTYTMGGVPPGTYYLITDNMNQSDYVNEWWAESGSVPDCNGAQTITVTGTESITQKNFQLDMGGSVSGTVYQSDGTTPITGVQINVTVYSGDPCGSIQHIAGFPTDSTNGTFTITGVPTGTYYLRTWNNGTFYRGEWWASPVSTVDCNGAHSFSINAGQSINNMDFQLDQGGIISGIVYENDGTTPITGTQIFVSVENGDPCTSSEQVQWGWTDTADGTYTIGGVPAGTHYLKTDNINRSNYVNEWWASIVSTPDCNGALSFTVSAGQTITGKNFQLDEGGTVSGTVFESDGTTPVTGVTIHVTVYSGDPCGSLQPIKGSPTDFTNGTFSITGVPAGTYYLKAHVSGTVYQGEWWAYPLSSVDCHKAQTITVNAGQTLANRNFQLNTGAVMTGTVTNDTDGQPVEGVQICGWPFPGGQGGQCATTLTDGTYTLNGLPPGYLKVEAKGAGFLTEYYDNSYDPNWATAVWAPAGQTTPNINFSMGHYGSISGTVVEGNRGMSTPLANICVDAYRHPCATDPFASARTDINGSYTIENLPPQAYYVKTRSACTHPLHYDDVWWNSTGGKTYCDQAGPVTVTSGQNTGGIDFSPIPSETTYPGPSFRSAGVFSAHHANESITTTFYAFIDGPGPEDVASFTATGPSGTFHLSLNQTPFIQRGNFYSTGSPSVVADGTYTFVVTDSLGRTATVERIFTYDSTVPQVDSATMKVDGMGNQAYVGTATPTLTWDAVSWPGTPGYYQAFVYDYDGRAIWYTEKTDGTSITIPEGHLQPDTPYKWWVRTGDTPEVGQRGQNRRFSNTLYFYTGTKGLPDLSTRSLLSYNTPDNGWANWFGISETNLAPWDIKLYNVTGPNGTTYSYNGRVYLLWHPVFYHCWSPGPAPTPGGTYTFGLEDNDLNTDTQTTAFTYNPATPVSEATRSPAPNAYLYTKTPTFSWSPPDRREAYYYNLRIYDYKRRIHWYSYSTTETSVTLPDTLDGPPGSYKWEVRTYTDPEHMNGAFSSARTFTIPPIAPYDYTLPGGTGQITDYRIFTVPYYMGTGADFLKALEKGLGPYDNTRWRIYGVDYPDNVEITSSDFASWNIIPGMGFWIISLNATPIQVEGTPCPQNNDYQLVLPSDWSLMALPWSSTHIDLGNIQVTDGINTYSITDAANNLTQRCVWQYTGTGPHNGYEKLDLSTDTLQCGTGYFLKVLAGTEVTVIFPPQNNRRSGRGERGSTGHEEEPPPPPGGDPQPEPFTCPDISSGRLENIVFPETANCPPYRFNGTLTLGNGVTIKEGASVTFKAE